MELVPSNVADIYKYYGDSYVKLPGFGDKLFLITKVNEDAIYFEDSNGKPGTITLHEDHPFLLDMVLPHKAMYQMGNYCFLLQRLPARQYNRGITEKNCRISALGEAGWTYKNTSFSALEGYTNKPMYRPLHEVIETRWSGSEALGARFAYLASNKGIYCDQKLVATVNVKEKIILCHPILIPEIERFLLSTHVSDYIVKAGDK